jgi:hypothetical protein
MLPEDDVIPFTALLLALCCAAPSGSDKMNTHLTIRTILSAAALAAVIGMTSALSVAWAGEVDARGKTLGASGPPEPSPYVDYDNTWLTGTAARNAARAMGWR